MDGFIEYGGFGYFFKERIVDVDEFIYVLDMVFVGGIVVDLEVVSILFFFWKMGVDKFMFWECEVLVLMV